MEPESLAELLTAPAHDAPEGVTPIFDNPPNKNYLAWLVYTSCAVFVVLSVILRLYARVSMYKQIHIEEGDSFLHHAFHGLRVHTANYGSNIIVLMMIAFVRKELHPRNFTYNAEFLPRLPSAGLHTLVTQ